MFPDQIKFWYFQIVFIVWKEEMGKGVSKSLQGVIRVALVKKESSTKPKTFILFPLSQLQLIYT